MPSTSSPDTILYAPLYVVPTPLGNLADISERARVTLCSVTWVAAEDTRHSAPLLKHLGSRARLLAAHEHNEEEAATKILTLLAAGESVALISDAGTPAISDPGARIVARVHAAGGKVIPLPGPCAAITALSAAGLSDPHWFFYGFLPTSASRRQKALHGLAGLAAALIFYEAPHRVLASVVDMNQCLGSERTLLIAREISKQFEEIARLPLGEAVAWFKADAMRQKGEFVLIVAGGKQEKEKAVADSGLRALQLLLKEGLAKSQAVRLAAALTGANRNALYECALRDEK
jgi:16S rRNA (cytidine1402-2'-O)-methyltransferase